MSSARQRGFTMIELVVVIVVLGILAAFAVPRFMGLDTQARIASVNALTGTLRSAAAMAHSVYLARGNPPNPVLIDGQSINFTAGYPNAATIGLLLSPGTVTGTNQVGTFSNAAGTGTFRLNGATTPAQCAVTYTAAAAGGSPNVVTVPANLGTGNPQIVGGC
jgi:MSHA pilin protein MshA